DLFHKDVPDDFILEVFHVMAKANWHIFQVLTKRSARLVKLVPKITSFLSQYTNQMNSWPPHIWLGVSIETIRYQWRVDDLRRVPASVRFISAEPLLGSLASLDLENIHWVIAGGESGRYYRYCNPVWIRELRDRCQSEGVAFFFKQ